MTEYEKVLSTEYSEKFDELRKNRMVVSHYKYGFIKESCEGKFIDTLETLKLRLQKYIDTKNTEFLVDVANFAMMEFMHPQLEGAYFRPTDSHESPGLVGMAPNEVKAFMNGELDK